jgi:site-specific DNA-methyltransferase (adenine-specific)
VVNTVYHRNALGVLGVTASDSVDLVYVDPPFGTGDKQSLARKKNGEIVSWITFEDPNVNYIEWLKGHMCEVHRVLKPNGTVYLHLDHHWVHRAKVMMDDEVFGPESFLNEVIWAYDFGGRGKRCWPKKHDNILVYVKDPNDHVFNWDDIDRIPYMAPGLQKDPARAEAGKVPTDVWWMSIVGTASKERNGYPTQKPVKLVERAVLASSPPGGLVMDVFAGSGTTGEAAHRHGRNFVLADTSPWAVETMKERFKDVDVIWVE